MARRMSRDKRNFLERLSLFGESLGLPPMAGRIWGWLLICDPPHQTAGQIAEAVGGSRASMTSMTRLLIQIGIVERISLPGQRSRFYQLRPGAFTAILEGKMSLTTEMRRITEEGLDLLEGKPKALRQRLQDYHDFYAFFEREFPLLIERWKKRKGR